jgi:hypothetical protein
MAQGNSHCSNQGEQSHHQRPITPAAICSSPVLETDQQTQSRSDHSALPVFRQQQVQACALRPTISPGIDSGDLRTSLHNSGQNYAAPVSYDQLQKQIEVLQQRLTLLQSQPGIGYISIALLHGNLCGNGLGRRGGEGINTARNAL